MEKKIIDIYDKMSAIRAEITELESFKDLTYHQKQRTLTVLLCDLQAEELLCEVTNPITEKELGR